MMHVIPILVTTEETALMKLENHIHVNVLLASLV